MKFWNKILSSKDPTSSKRLVTLIISAHFIIASFTILFIANYVIFYVPKGQIDKELLSLLKEVLEYDFYIILSGLGFITADGLVTVMGEKAKAQAQALSGFYQNAIEPLNKNEPILTNPEQQT
jgi:hypothetical protein